MTKTKQVFNPADSERVTMYMCGPTVYNHAHIGNFRAAVAFDMVYRVLRHKYGADKIVYARNFTDIEDKIIVAAKKNQSTHRGDHHQICGNLPQREWGFKYPKAQLRAARDRACHPDDYHYRTIA